MGQGNVFTGVCDSVDRRGCLVPGGGLVRGVSARGGCLLPGVSAPGGAWWRPPGTANAAGGTHPTGMHSCFSKAIILFKLLNWSLNLSVMLMHNELPK